MFGKSVFESVLERLRAEAEEAGTPSDNGERLSGIHRNPSAPFTIFGDGMGSSSAAYAAAAYRDIFGDGAQEERDPAPAAPPATPSHLLRTAPEEVAADLGLTGKETRAQLLALRRAFARINHPDGVPAELRSNATRRMMIANMLLDETLRRMQAEEALGLKG
ncbi:hypothetical protein IB238_11185 [Rhizobium sp. ARZ01]|uniref:hypothetical protein n=1 Tax=Rhizobium sp. ARZ01 TaxID=2769313 RepID=UPI001782664F|nr:hypothetical protein [Rhizobium sp. ARZ01]MBD9373183.1 hypothetical protein [Rhizobium sp. ARZ01]